VKWAMFTYPWDLHDEGIELALDTIGGVAGINEVILAVSYHVATYLLPHNPRRRFYFGEDGAIFWQPEAALYPTELQPRMSELVTGPDYLPAIVRSLKARGLRFNAWIVFCYNHHLARRHPHLTQTSALGDHHLAQLCPAQPAVRQYAAAMAEDVVRNHGADGIYLESLNYLAFGYGQWNPKVFIPLSPLTRFLLGVCFCPACKTAAVAAGVDAEGLQHDVAEFLSGAIAEGTDEDYRSDLSGDEIRRSFSGRLAPYLDVRAANVTAAWRTVIERARQAAGGRTLAVEAGLPLQADDPVTGMRVAELAPLLDSRYLSGPDQRGSEWWEAARALSLQKPAATVQLVQGQMNSQEQILDWVGRSRSLGAGLAFYNYGLLRRKQLSWIGESKRLVGR